MASTDDVFDEYGSKLVRLLEDIHSHLPPGIATLEARKTKDNHGTIVWLRPTNTNAAEFSAHTEDGLAVIDVSFGKAGTTFELPWDAKLPSDATFDTMSEAVREMCIAVISGMCEDRQGYLGLRGTILLEGKRALRVTHFFYPSWHRSVLRYAPYHQSPG